MHYCVLELEGGGMSGPGPGPTPQQEPDSVKGTPAQPTFDDIGDPLRPSRIFDAFKETDPGERRRLGLPEGDDSPTPVLVELNLLHAKGLAGADEGFMAVYQRLDLPVDRSLPREVANTYYRCDLSYNEVRRLIQLDQQESDSRQRSIYRVWPDFPVQALLDRSISTVKADAARRSYNAAGVDIVWAVVDSGIDEQHPHFDQLENLKGDVAELHKSFIGDDAPLKDEFGHGTHVAGILAGGLPEGAVGDDGLVKDTDVRLKIGERVAVSDESEFENVQERRIKDAGRLTGVAPHCKLVSLKVLDKAGRTRSSQVMEALQYIREKVNGHGRLLRVHGVNLSIGYPFNARWFACGQSPICVEVDRLVKTGVVVVAAAGNTGYGELTAREGLTSTGLSLTINDPGNAVLAITVGATHRDSPHLYGVSDFSSKGPTGDGRLKPDLVAPGERITSCATGKRRDLMKKILPAEDGTAGDAGRIRLAPYLEESGTSMAAPHVSGVIAAFLSIRREFIGRPEEVKRIFLENATSLGRERYFEGHGLVDLMRAIQAV
jgi:serine protease AprX